MCKKGGWSDGAQKDFPFWGFILSLGGGQINHQKGKSSLFLGFSGIIKLDFSMKPVWLHD